MLTDQEMLRYIYQNAETSQNGIHGILPYVTSHPLQKALEEQQKTHTRVYHQAAAMLNQRGTTPQGTNLAAKLFTRVAAEARAVTDTSPSHLAEMLIEKNTAGMAKMQKHLNNFHAGDAHIRALAEEQIKTAQENIEQMKPFL